jgi:pimeloyl-ACP methyl ester carboxylesterase
VTGDGLPIAFLHGQPGSGSDWDGVVAALPAGLNCLALDRPGYRVSPHPPGGFETNARWLLAELDRQGIARAILVGHSYGGGIALTAASLAPERVIGLVLIGSVGPDCLDGWDALLAAPVAGTVCAVTAWWLTPWFARRRIARIERILERPLAADEHLNWEAWASARHEHGAMWRTFLTEQRDLVHGIDALTARLPTITAPALVISAIDDGMIPVETAHALCDQLPNARLSLIERGGHQLPRRIPLVIAEHIAEFVRSLPDSEPSTAP